MKRSTLVGRKTSVTLEDEFWTALKEIATTQNVGISLLISTIDSQRQNNNLSSAIRVHVLNHYSGKHGTKT
jgi:predicted DNA-binding ribbon-helix-helix protein